MTPSKTQIEDDAEGQFATSQGDRKNNGLASATPRTVTGMMMLRQKMRRISRARIPASTSESRRIVVYECGKMLATPAGLEPATTCLEGRCSIQLS